MSDGNGGREALRRALDDLPHGMIYDDVMAADTLLLLLAEQGYIVKPIREN